MFREFDENEELNFGDSMKSQKGSNRKVIDPIQSIIRNTNLFIKQAETNICRQKLADLAQCSGVGEYIELVDKKDHDLGDTIPVYIKGKRKYLVTDPSVVKAVQRMDRDNSGSFIKLLQIPVTIGRACFVMINPSFAIRNVLRDGADAAIYSKYGFTPKDAWSGFVSSIHQDEMFWKWMVAGGAQASAISVDRDYTEATIDKLTRTKWECMKSFRSLTDNGALRALQAAGEYTEYATRVGAFERNLKNMQSEEGKATRDAMITAAFESRDLMDFARGGRYSRTLNKISLFSNAAIQGWDKFFRTFDPRDKKTFMRATARLVLTSMLPALTLSLLFRGDDWWEEAPDWLKENNWLMKVGDTIIRVPKGQDIGIKFFSNFIEKGISKTGKMDADLLTPLYDALPSLVPFGLLPIAEVASNHSFFTHGKVVPGYLERLPDDKQYNTSTSSLARFFGENLGYSPIKIDHLITGYTGNVYKTLSEFVNFIGRDKKSLPTAADAPILQGVTYMPYKNPASVTEFYDKWDKVQKEHVLYNQTGKARDGYSEAEYKKMSKVNKQLSALAKKERAVVENPTLTNSDRYDKQMAIQKQRMNIVRSLK